MDNVIKFKKPDRDYDELLKTIFYELKNYVIFEEGKVYNLELQFKKKDSKTFGVEFFKVAEIVNKN